MVGLGIHYADKSPSLLQWGAYLVLVLVAVAIFYSLNLAMMTTGIWLVRVDNLFILGETVTQVARNPLDIYPLGVQKVLTYAVPLGLLSTIPARQLVRGFDGGMVALGLVWGIAAVLFSRWFWRYALRSYSSASS